MTWLEWTLMASLLAIYLVCLFTVCSLTFSKGYTLLGVIGIFLPLLWLIGAVLPPKEGSRYAVQEATRYQQAMREMTS